MLPYLICVGASDEIAAVKTRSWKIGSLSMRQVSPSCLIWTDSGSTLHRFEGDRGAVLGTLFHRYGSSFPVLEIDSSDSAAIEESGGRHLLERFWGAYIAYLPMPDGHIILRDPSGMLPCNYVARSGLHLLASEPGLLVETGLFEPCLDTRAVARFLFRPSFPTEATPFDGLADLLPGMALELRGGRARTRFHWNPWDHVPSAPDVSAEENAERLYRTVTFCVSAWGRVYDHGLVGVSGGLDSSIVAAQLKTSGNMLSCLTMMTDDPMGDERRFARALATDLEIDLLEARYALEDVAINRSSVYRRARPMGRTEALAYDAALLRAAHSLGSNAIFTGNGGDNLFYMSRSARPVADRYLAEGLSPGLVKTLFDVARLTGASVPSVLRHAIGALRRRSKPYAWQQDTRFLAKGMVGDLCEEVAIHPWLEVPDDKPFPGKAAHIAMILRLQHSVEGYDRRGPLPVIHPLASQPILELCLSIPTWQQCTGGRDRAVARKAFAGHLPAAVIERRGKGGPDGFINEIMRHFHSEIRERLLDGYLVSAGIADRAALEQALDPNQMRRAGTALRLMSLLDTEAWAAHWRRR